MKNKKLYTQIRAGKYKGKKIELPSLETTRSTKSIIKESLFNTLQFDIIDQNFIEVFGGSGTVGLEAVSRGAKCAYFIEKDHKAYNILRKNCKVIDENRTETFLGDSFEIYGKVIQEISQLSEKAYIYFDPPFSFRDGMDNVYQKVYTLIKNTPKKLVNLIIVEHMTKLKLPETLGAFKQKKSKKFGKSSLTYYIVE